MIFTALTVEPRHCASRGAAPPKHRSAPAPRQSEMILRGPIHRSAALGNAPLLSAAPRTALPSRRLHPRSKGRGWIYSTHRQSAHCVAPRRVSSIRPASAHRHRKATVGATRRPALLRIAPRGIAAVLQRNGSPDPKGLGERYRSLRSVQSRAATLRSAPPRIELDRAQRYGRAPTTAALRVAASRSARHRYSSLCPEATSSRKTRGGTIRRNVSSRSTPLRNAPLRPAPSTRRRRGVPRAPEGL